jgi:hypothetical protein
MSASVLIRMFRMAAPAAILLFLPSVALAEVCEKTANFSYYLPLLDGWLTSMPDGDQLRKFFTPTSLVTAGVLIWLIASNTTRATMVAVVWFLCLSIFHAFEYLSIDLADPYYLAAIQEGCVENSPRHILSNLGFAAIAVLLTWQRLRRQKTG